MSKEKKRKVNVDKEKEGLVYFEIWGILVIVFSFILLSELGPVGGSLNTLVKILFGDYYWLTLIFLIYYGVMMILYHQFITYSSIKLKGIIFISAGLLMYSHFPIYNHLENTMNDSGSNLVVQTYNLFMSYLDMNVKDPTFGGGIVGAGLLTVTLMLIGEIGSKIIAIILLASGFAFLFEKTIYDFFEDLYIGIKNFCIATRNQIAKAFSQMHQVSKDTKIKDKFLKNHKVDRENQEDDVMEDSKPFIHVKADHITYEKPKYKKMNIKNLKYHDNTKILERQKDITLNNAKAINKFLNETLAGLEIDEIYIGPSISTYIIKLKSLNQKNTIISNTAKLYTLIGTDQIRIYDEYIDTQLLKIEIPNDYCYLISLREILDEGSKDSLIIGRDYKGEFYKLNFDRSFNLLIIGNDINSKIDFLKLIVLEIIYGFTPEEVALVLCDSTKFELNEFKDIDHLFTPFIDDVKLAKQSFIKLYTEMEYRLNGHHSKDQAIVVIINDLADFYVDDYKKYLNYMLMYGAKVNIFIICSTINLDEDVLTINFRSMFENMLAFQIKNRELSQKFIDMETHKLLKNGDCIMSDKNKRTFTRVQLVTLQESDYVI